MKNLLTNDVMLTTTRVWLKITSPQKRAVSYKMTARTQAHSVRNTPNIGNVLESFKLGFLVVPNKNNIREEGCVLTV